MNKPILTLAFSLMLSFTFAQTTYVFDENGDISPNPFITEVTGTKMELYNKTLKWIKLNYYNPDEVITSKIEGEFIRISGAQDIENSDPIVYILEIEFKDNKYRTSLVKTNNADEKNGKTVVNSIQLLTPGDKYSKTQKMIDLLKEVYQPWLDASLKHLNNANLSVYNYLSGTTEKKDGW